MSKQRELIEDNISTYLELFLTQKMPEIQHIWKDYLGDKDDSTIGIEFNVFRAQQDVLTPDPSIEIIFRNCKTEIYSIATQHDTYTYDILINVASNHPTMGDTFLRIVAKVIQDSLNDFTVRTFEVPKQSFCAYYSEATDLDLGFRRGKGFRSARISWMCKILKPNRF